MTDPDRTITTDRLLLSPHVIGDFAFCLTLWQDPDVLRFISAEPQSRRQIWDRLLRYGGLWSLFGYGFWVIRTRPELLPIGEIGFGRFRREMGPDVDDLPEMGWVMIPSAQGSGYALEAGRAALQWATVRVPSDRVVCAIHPQNDRSLRLAQQLGFTDTRTSFLNGAASTVMHATLR